MNDVLVFLFILSFAVASISYTLAKATITQTARFWIWQHWQWFGRVLSCSYCVSHWVAFAFAWVIEPTPWRVFVTTFILIGMSAVILNFFPETHDASKRTDKGQKEGSQDRRDAQGPGAGAIHVDYALGDKRQAPHRARSKTRAEKARKD